MKLRILSVGKPRRKELISLHDLYAGRIRQLDVGFDSDWVAEVRSGGRYSDEHVQEREARLLAGKADGRGSSIALDPGGRLLTSEDLAGRLERLGHDRATFVIGGPLGLHRSVRDGADWCWSLSPLTLPHELARVVVAEQLYRALTILRGLPYHK
jgi:23S rRNA (pseudouridine1915-N3)-methyltransferase